MRSLKKSLNYFQKLNNLNEKLWLVYLIFINIHNT